MLTVLTGKTQTKRDEYYVQALGWRRVRRPQLAAVIHDRYERLRDRCIRFIETFSVMTLSVLSQGGRSPGAARRLRFASFSSLFEMEILSPPF
jgi:hypothetical protein